MPFDLCKHKINFILIRAGTAFFPEEKNVTVLLKKAAFLLGVTPEIQTSNTATHLPTPQETGPFFICPKCGKERMIIDGLCPSCKDSEAGKYRSMLYCECGFKEKSPTPQAILWVEHGYTGPTEGVKKKLGMKTITDTGRK